jgi:hypothetical protein
VSWKLVVGRVGDLWLGKLGMWGQLWLDRLGMVGRVEGWVRLMAGCEWVWRIRWVGWMMNIVRMHLVLSRVGN